MPTPAIRKWQRWATHALKRMTHKPTTLHTFYTKTDPTPSHNALWYTSTSHGHRTRHHDAVRGPALHQPKPIYTPTRPTFLPHTEHGERQVDRLTIRHRRGCTPALAREVIAQTGVTIEEYDCCLPCGLRPIHFTPLHPYAPDPKWGLYNTRMQQQFAGLTGTPNKTRRRKATSKPLLVPLPMAPRTSTIAVMLGRSVSDDTTARTAALRRKALQDQVVKRRRLNPTDPLAHTVRIDTILHPAAPNPEQPPTSPPFSATFTEAMHANYISGESCDDSDYDSSLTSECSDSDDSLDDVSTDIITNVPIPPDSRHPPTL
jgi:hypothetical protein